MIFLLLFIIFFCNQPVRICVKPYWADFKSFIDNPDLVPGKNPFYSAVNASAPAKKSNSRFKLTHFYQGYSFLFFIFTQENISPLYLQISTLDLHNFGILPPNLAKVPHYQNCSSQFKNSCWIFLIALQPELNAVVTI